MATPSPIIAHYIDQPLSWNSVPRCLMIRGWCFGTNGAPIRAIRLKAADLTLLGVTGKSRPDVKAAMPNAPDDCTGFEIRCILPSGRLELSIEAQLTDGSWHAIFSQTVNVFHRWRPLWLGGGDWTELMFSQVSCQMQYLPRSLKPERFPPLNSEQASGPKFSIVTPSFQQTHFLPDALRSVLGQTGVACEYVVQDGGSTDGSAEVIRRFAQEQGALTNDPSGPKAAPRHQPASLNSQAPYPTPQPSSLTSPRLTAWTSEPDAGQADAIAKGFAKTSGGPDDLMAWINSDDFYLPGTFAFVADFFTRHPDVDVIYGHRLLVDEASLEIGRWFLPEHDDEVLKLYDFVPQETMFWRRRIWDKVGGLDTSYKFAMDWDLLLRFQAAGARIVRLPYFLACFRIHSAQKTAALMETVGQGEIDALRLRTHHRYIPPPEIEAHPKLLGYLRRSAWLKFLWRLGIRTR